MNRLTKWLIRGFFLVWIGFLWFYAKDPFSFLALNTLLGAIPILISFHLGSKHPRAFIYWPVFIVWLLFYPNSPYLLTDLFHLTLLQPYAAQTGLLRQDPHMWTYYTLIMISVLVCSLLGFWSLHTVSRSLANRLGHGQTWLQLIFVCGLTLLSSVGIYIGRFLRLHTIYLLLTPNFVIQPLLKMWTPTMLYFVFLMTVVQLVGYCVVWLITANQQSETKITD
ncbi:DUF1361 domain-containing protein [Levilactobacillus bambusae]|uniref:DUF1361 domain-containing protein n=1 Tax=Levilactobacillus bambusae TaxID=2024736 RepID=A0A2V1MX78_9LACO|nr:DUF1361 domain-containing protein [Levilactobacillus bambusae]PWF99628.1 DUF1361 domain-containing protein [Levilactobacillus bambusae]